MDALLQRPILRNQRRYRCWLPTELANDTIENKLMPLAVCRCSTAKNRPQGSLAGNSLGRGIIHKTGHGALPNLLPQPSAFLALEPLAELVFVRRIAP